MSNSKLFNLFEAAAKAGANVDKAKRSLSTRAADLISEGVSVADLKGDGRHFEMMQDATARAILTSAEFAIYSNVELAAKQRVKGDDGKVRQVNTAKGKLVDRVNSAIRNVRDAMKVVLAGDAPRGTKEKATPTEAFVKAIDGYIERLAKPEASDTFDFDPVVARQHLVALIKAIK